jgi:uridine kinase
MGAAPATFVRRLVRDLRERCKPPATLVRRGIALLRAEPAVLRRQAGLGCQPAGDARIVRQVGDLVAAGVPAPVPVPAGQPSRRA